MFEIKINNGILKQRDYFLKLTPEESAKIESITSYNELEVIYNSLSEYHKKLVTHKKFSMRDNIEIYGNLNNNKIMQLVKTIKRGCFTTLIFNL
jgi:hypothetical protein